MEKYNTSLTKLAEEALMPECARRGYFRIDLADNCNIRCIMCQAYNALPVNSIRFIDFDRFCGSDSAANSPAGSSSNSETLRKLRFIPGFRIFLRYIRSEAPDSTIHIVTTEKRSTSLQI
jgi:hypothetical protein